MSRWKFLHPFTSRFVGPSACGKSTFLCQVIEQKLIEPFPESITYFYGSAWQDGIFDMLQTKHKVHFVRGFDESIVNETDASKPSLIICDDLILEMKDSEAAANLFMRGSHHTNTSVILIEQNLFPKGRQSVSMKSNTQYLVLFKSPADALGVAQISKQMYPQNRGKFLIDSYTDCTKEPYTYLIVDSKQATPDQVRLVTNVTDPKSHPIVYVRNHREAAAEISSFNQQVIGRNHRKQQQQQSSSRTRGERDERKGTIFS
jgi:hypothetical protein